MNKTKLCQPRCGEMILKGNFLVCARCGYKEALKECLIFTPEFMNPDKCLENVSHSCQECHRLATKRASAALEAEFERMRKEKGGSIFG